MIKHPSDLLITVASVTKSDGALGFTPEVSSILLLIRSSSGLSFNIDVFIISQFYKLCSHPIFVLYAAKVLKAEAFGTAAELGKV